MRLCVVFMRGISTSVSLITCILITWTVNSLQFMKGIYSGPCVSLNYTPSADMKWLDCDAENHLNWIWNCVSLFLCTCIGRNNCNLQQNVHSKCIRQTCLATGNRVYLTGIDTSSEPRPHGGSHRRQSWTRLVPNCRARWWLRLWLGGQHLCERTRRPGEWCWCERDCLCSMGATVRSRLCGVRTRSGVHLACLRFAPVIFRQFFAASPRWKCRRIHSLAQTTVPGTLRGTDNPRIDNVAQRRFVRVMVQIFGGTGVLTYVRLDSIGVCRGMGDRLSRTWITTPPCRCVRGSVSNGVARARVETRSVRASAAAPLTAAAAAAITTRRASGRSARIPIASREIRTGIANGVSRAGVVGFAHGAEILKPVVHGLDRCVFRGYNSVNMSDVVSTVFSVKWHESSKNWDICTHGVWKTGDWRQRRSRCKKCTTRKIKLECKTPEMYSKTQISTQNKTHKSDVTKTNMNPMCGRKKNRMQTHKRTHAQHGKWNLNAKHAKCTQIKMQNTKHKTQQDVNKMQ